MQDVVGYILILGLVVLSGYGIIRVGVALLQAVYQNSSMILSFPFL